MSVSSRRKIFNAIYVGVLMLFILAGVDKVPFHGDESTIIYMSKDWYSLVQSGNLSEVLYKPTPQPGQPTDDQELRLLNGTISKFSIGLAGSLAGFNAQAINGAWAWGLDWWQNLYYGHLPSHVVLFVSRLSSTWLLLLSVALVFNIAYQIGGAFTAYWASFLYGTTASVLLNARRAMFEGANLLSIALVLFAGVALVNVLDSRAASSPRLLRRWLFFGVAAGFALASKHVNIITIAAVVLALLWIERRHLLRFLKYASLSGVVALIIFLLLNPTWWSEPFQMPRVVLGLRQTMMSRQTNAFGQFENFPSRLAALVDYPFGSLQYEEDAKFDWTQWIGDQIKAYDASLDSGIRWSGILFYFALATGLIALSLIRPSLRHLIVITTALIVLSILFSNELPWQRYYLPVVIPLVLLCALGLSKLPVLVRRSRQLVTRAA